VQVYFRPSITAWIAGRSACPAATILSRSSAAQFMRAGYRSSGRSKNTSGSAAGGGRLSRAKVSKWAV
jgi:hypothetical protein